MLGTSLDSQETVRELQRKLYRKAKQQPDFRFYALYDKVYRSDVLLDGQTFEAIERAQGKEGYLRALAETLRNRSYRSGPIQRVDIPKGNGETRPLGIPGIGDRVVQTAVKLVIEPIFEAGFCTHSYGFRPKRSAQDAMEAIKEGLFKGQTQVIDADLSKYFDTIVHEKLMKAVAERVADKSILRLLNEWLKAVVIQVKEGKQAVIAGGKRNRKGTPQGGVVSPLLANVYLNLLDRIWEKHRLEQTHKARLIRYADDLVILCAGETDEPSRILQIVLGKLELQLNEDKTQTVDARRDKFDFLGFEVSLASGTRSGKRFPLIEPSAKAMNSVKQKIKFYTRRDMTPVPIDEIVGKLNEVVRGWSAYFYYGHGHRKIRQVKYYMEESLRRHLRYRHKLPNRGAAYLRFPRKYLYDELGLYKPPITPIWKVAHA